MQMFFENYRAVQDGHRRVSWRLSLFIKRAFPFRLRLPGRTFTQLFVGIVFAFVSGACGNKPNQNQSTDSFSATDTSNSEDESTKPPLCPRPSGELQWTRVFNSGILDPEGIQSSMDWGQGISSDDRESLFLVGQVNSDAASWGDLWLARAQVENGNIMWERVHKSAIGYDVEGLGVATVPGDGVVVTGVETLEYNPPNFPKTGIWVGRYNQDGELLWQDVNEQTPQTQDGQGNGITVTPSGQIIAVGQLREFGEENAQWLRSYAKNGEILWTTKTQTKAQIDGAISSSAYAVAAGPFGNVFVTGVIDVDIETDLARNIVLSRYSLEGQQEWTVSEPHQNGFDFGSGVAVANNGEVIVVGQLGPSSNVNETFVPRNAWLRRYHADGQTIWTQTLTEPEVHSRANDVAIDLDGNIVVVGTTDTGRGDDEGLRAWVRKLDSSGKQLWERSFENESTINRTTSLHGVTITSDCNIYAFGHMHVDGENFNHFLVALEP